MITKDAKLTELVVPEIICMPQVVGSAGVTSPWINFGKAYRVCVAIMLNNASTVTGSVITFNQATAAAGTGSKALTTFNGVASGITTAGAVDVNFNPTTSDLNTNGYTYATSSTNTYLTASTGSITGTTLNNAANVVYVNILASDLDVANKFNFFNVSVAQGVAQTVAVIALFYPPRWEDAPQQTLLT